MSDSVERIKERLGIADVVSSYLKLERAGQNFKARCPFHNEKTPSFFVSPSRGTYHCFGCNRGGDQFSFVEEIEGIPFLEALKLLADRAGVALTREDPKRKTERERAFLVLQSATEYFASQLKTHTEAREYLQERGLTSETVESFKLGFAPAGWRNVKERLAGLGFGEDDIERAGLIIRSPKDQKQTYDRFRGRIMFPIEDGSGRVIGFSGRVFGTADETEAKYINSPQTVLFDKSRALYGYSRAKDEMRKENRVVLVEGQIDVLLSHQAGFKNTVGVSGTALSPEHLRMMKRMADQLVMAFDADTAGIAAGARAYKLAIEEGFNVTLAELPEGMDPADLVVRDPSLWQKALEGARHVIEVYLERISKTADRRAQAVSLSREVLPLVARIPSRTESAHFIRLASSLLNLKEDALWEDLEKIRSAGGDEVAPESYVLPKRTRREMIMEKVVGSMFWQDKLGAAETSGIPGKSDDDAERFRTLVGDEVWKRFIELPKDDRERMAFEAELYYGGVEDVKKVTQDLLDNLEIEILRDELVASIEKLRASERQDDEREIKKHLERCRDLSLRLSAMKATIKA